MHRTTLLTAVGLCRPSKWILLQTSCMEVGCHWVSHIDDIGRFCLFTPLLKEKAQQNHSGYDFSLCHFTFVFMIDNI